MKKIIFASAVVLLVALGATAQRNTSRTTTTTSRTTANSRTNNYSSSEGSTGLANTILLYGDVGFTSHKDAGADDASSTINFNPGIGYQFNDNWAIGLQAVISSDKDPQGGGDFFHHNEFEVGPFVRYTKGLSNIFNVYGQLDLGFHSTKDKDEALNTEDKSNGINANIFPAIGANVKNLFMLNFSFGGLGFKTDKADVNGAKTSHDFDFNFGKVITIGISKNF